MVANGKANAFAGQATHVVQAANIYGGLNSGQHVLPVPRQLPRAATHFTARTDALDRLDELAAAENGIATISGPAGVGKSALAVYWAHSRKEVFPDGQLYVNLCGYDQRAPLRPEDVLHGFLYALNAPADRVVGDLDAASALFRSLIDGKRLLVVADNASSADQVRPLLPSSPGCFTLVTSRNRLGSLTVVDGATLLPVRPLDTPEAVQLFQRLSGHQDTRSVTQLVLRCGCIPLFVRITAERASAVTYLSGLVEDLTRDSDRLEALSTLDDGMDARMVLSWSYRGLPSSAGRAFRLLALHAGPDFSITAAAALIDRPENETRRILEKLGAVNMLEEVGGGRYRYHDVLRDYARERVVEEETPSVRLSALRRELSYYLRRVDACDRILAPERQHVPLDQGMEQGPAPFSGPDAALAWCESELPSLVDAVGQAVELGFDDIAWKLPVALVYFLRLQRRDTYRFELSAIAVDAARREGDPWAEVWSLICLGGASSDLERHEDALGHFTEALRISREIQDRRWEAISIYNLAWTLRLLGRNAEGLERQRQALVIQQESGDRRSASITLTEIGALELNLGRPDRAHIEFERALAGARATADLPTEGKSLHGLGDVCRTAGRTSEAIEWYRQAADVRQRVGDRFGLACSLFELGKQLATVGRPAEAGRTLAQAVVILDDLKDPLVEDVRRCLADNGGEMD
ncbi:ATP-binding protein [Streptomyces olivoreticuli]|uniref:ATP-binding protein n=1 Tax=Streptomyces olivoreticuli TaxID=68246 RepID=UPI0013C36426|nr:tetratricopeptide repeat protein [Streptomyces olivoreticuli]